MLVVYSFSRVSVRILGEKGVVLVKNLNMDGESIAVVGNNGLIEVDLKPTIDGRVLHS